MSSPPQMNHEGGLAPERLRFEGVVFDLDGVITQTAHLHAETFKILFDEFLRKRIGDSFQAFDIHYDYTTFVDGKPRYDGVKAFLESRNLSIEYGDESDSPDKETICGLGNKKNIIFNKLIEEKGVQVYESTVELIHQLKEKKVKIGVASSSKNCKKVLEIANIEHLFQAKVDGLVSSALQLRGKPQPDIFLECCYVLGIRPERSVVVEDAVSGVEAGKNGGFGLVVGVDRGGNREALLQAGADIVIGDFQEISIWSLNDAFPYRFTTWTLLFDTHSNENEKWIETLSTLGNGYMAVRGSFVETLPEEEDIKYPGTYIAGAYNKLKHKVEGRTVETEDLVNFPNWARLTFKTPNSQSWFDWTGREYKADRLIHKLNIHEGVDSRRYRVTDAHHQRSSIICQRFVHSRKYHMSCLKYSIISENWEGDIQIKSILDGSVRNRGVMRYRQFQDKHLQVTDMGTFDLPNSEEGMFLSVRTTNSNIDTSFAARTSLFIGEHRLQPKNREVVKDKESIAQLLTVHMKPGTILVVEKIVATCSSRDKAVLNTLEAALDQSQRYYHSRYYNLLNSHQIRWFGQWNRGDLKIKLEDHETQPICTATKHSELIERYRRKDPVLVTSKALQLVLRFHTFHMLQTLNVNNVGLDVSIPARGLHGESYRGHYFWDELFVLSAYNIRFPDATRSILLYRFFRLDAARDIAKKMGLKGACFPWQSASTGKEETPNYHLNPIDNKWYPDHSTLQLHVNIAIFYNVWNYFSVTADFPFLEMYGAEIMLEIARFWSMRTTFNEKRGRYEILGVMGPDEFHEKYPNSEQAGFNNNTYTNVMVVWCLRKALQTIQLLTARRRSELLNGLHITSQELNRWSDITHRMIVIFHKDHILSQFEGYEDLKEFDWDHYRKTYGNIQRLDRILKAENDSTDNYKLSKQADTCMLFYLLTQEEVLSILKHLGYSFSTRLIHKTIQYYLQRCSHGSTLSLVVYSNILYHYNTEEAWKMYKEFILSDICDLQGGTTAEGIHVAMMAASVNMVIFQVCGLDTTGEGLTFKPLLPKDIKFLSYRLWYKMDWIHVELTPTELKVSMDADSHREVYVTVWNKKHNLIPGSAIKVELTQCDRSSPTPEAL